MFEIDKTQSAKRREKALERRKNRKWLNYSGKIALRLLAAIEDTPNMNQKLLAELAEVSPQQVSKIVKGQENLTLETIAKFSSILNVELITFPSFKYNQKLDFGFTTHSSIAALMPLEGNMITYACFISGSFNNNITSFIAISASQLTIKL